MAETLTYTEMFHPHLLDRDLYKKLYTDLHTSPVYDHVRHRMWMRHFLPKPNSRIVDLGAGTGPNLIHYAKLGHTVDGVEVAQTACDIFYKHLYKQSDYVAEKVSMTCGWIEDFEGTGYDYALVSEVLEHVIDPVEILRKAKQVIKDDGEIYLSGPTSREGNASRHVREITTDAVMQWADEVGLRIVWCEQTPNRTYCRMVKG